MNAVKVGDRVEIKTGWARGEWGIVKLIKGNEYHVGIANSNTSVLVYWRNELLKRKSRS